MYQKYKDRGLMVITLMAENGSGVTPSVDELKSWANQYNLTHPVLADDGWVVTRSYIGNGGIGLPTETLLASGMIVNRIDTWVQDSDIEALLP